MPLCVRTDGVSTLLGRLGANVRLGSICPANTSVKVLLSSNNDNNNNLFLLRLKSIRRS